MFCNSLFENEKDVKQLLNDYRFILQCGRNDETKYWKYLHDNTLSTIDKLIDEQILTEDRFGQELSNCRDVFTCPFRQSLNHAFPLWFPPADFLKTLTKSAFFRLMLFPDPEAYRAVLIHMTKNIALALGMPGNHQGNRTDLAFSDDFDPNVPSYLFVSLVDKESPKSKEAFQLMVGEDVFQVWTANKLI